MNKWLYASKTIEKFLRLRTFPVAFKLFETDTALDAIKGLRRPDNKPRMCQLITLARVHGWTVGATKEQLGSPVCASIIGLCKPPEKLIEGKVLCGILYKNSREASKHELAVNRIPAGKYKALAVAPLAGNKIEPDIVLIYGNPAQIFMLIAAVQWIDFETLNFYCVGESSCSDAIVRCYLNNKPSLGIPPYAERRYAGAQDDELVLALPSASISKILRGLKGIYKGGIRYPVASWVAQTTSPSLLQKNNK